MVPNEGREADSAIMIELSDPEIPSVHRDQNERRHTRCKNPITTQYDQSRHDLDDYLPPHQSHAPKKASPVKRKRSERATSIPEEFVHGQELGSCPSQAKLARTVP